MAANDAQTGADPVRVFISYSRQDVEFADTVELALSQRNFELLIDRQGIGPQDAWQDRVDEMILGSDVIVFVLTEKSATSAVCAWEIEQASRLRKKKLVVVPGPLPPGIVPPADLSRQTWIHCWRNPDEPGSSLKNGLLALERALTEDAAWRRIHTRLTERVVDWKLGHQDLLRDEALDRALAWRAGKPANETVLGLIDDFLDASRRTEHESEETQRAHQQKLAVLEREKRDAEDRAEEERQRRERAQRRGESQMRQADRLERSARPPLFEAEPRPQPVPPPPPPPPQFQAPRPQPAPPPPPPPPPPLDDLFAQSAAYRAARAQPQERFDPFDDPAFRRGPTQLPVKRAPGRPPAKAQRRPAGDDYSGDEPSNSAWSVLGIAAVLICLLIGGAALLSVLPSMPNPFSTGQPPGAGARQTSAEPAPDADPAASAKPPAPVTKTAAKPAGETKPAAAAAPPPKPAAQDADDAAWETARKAGTLLALRTYMVRQPKGRNYDEALKQARLRIGKLSVHPISTIVVLPGPVMFRELPTHDDTGQKSGSANQDLTILDRIASPREGEWLVFERTGPWPFRFVSAADIGG